MKGQWYRLSKPWAIWLAFVLTFWLLLSFLPLDRPLLFYDWRYHLADTDLVPTYYTPWTRYVHYLGLPGLISITLATFAVAVLVRARSRVSMFSAFLAVPLYWTLFLGHVDGLVLLGLETMPWLVPLALMKPHLTAWAIVARREWFFAAALFGLLSLVLWGPWPMDVLTASDCDAPGACAPERHLGLWGLPATAFLIWKMPRDDPDWWMLAGAFVTPRLFPYNLVVLMPAVARLPWPWALAVAVTSWLPFSANWLGDWAWWLMWVSVAVLAVGMYSHCREKTETSVRLFPALCRANSERLSLPVSAARDHDC
jgi:hypothetical protein